MKSSGSSGKRDGRGPDHSPLVWAAGHGVTALVLGLLFVYPRQWTRGFLINDEAWNAELARNLSEGLGFVTETLYPIFASHVASLPTAEPFKQVGYPLVGALVASVTGLSERQLVAVSLAGFFLTGMATWFVSHAIVKNRLVATAITLATIGNPQFWSHWTAALPESIFTAIFLGGIWLLLWPSAGARFGAGVLLASGLYFKGYAVLYLPLAGAFLLFDAHGRRVRHAGSYVAGVVVALMMGSALLPFRETQVPGTAAMYAGSILLYETRGAYPQPLGPLYDIAPIEPFSYILTHPLDYAEKVVRMVSRTKATAEEIGGPAFGGVLFPLLLFVALSVVYDLVCRLRSRRERQNDLGEGGESRPVVLLLVVLIAANFVFFWAGNFKARYFSHLFPLMLAAAAVEFVRLVPAAREWRRSTFRPLLVAAVAYFLILPPLVGLWNAYRDPYAYLGRMLAVRWVDYRQVAENVKAHVPEDGMVMSDMAHEISWYTGRPTVHFPGSEDQVEYLLEKFDVRALYEHPRTTRDWTTLRERFELVDDRNGRFWLRRR